MLEMYEWHVLAKWRMLEHVPRFLFPSKCYMGVLILLQLLHQVPQPHNLHPLPIRLLPPSL